MIDAHRQRIFLADVAARLVDHRQPVGVGVLAEADVGAGSRDRRQHAGEVFGGRLGRVGELAVGLFAQHGHAAGQFVQQPAAQDAAGAVVASPRPRGTGRWRIRSASIVCQDGQQMGA